MAAAALGEVAAAGLLAVGEVDREGVGGGSGADGPDDGLPPTIDSQPDLAALKVDFKCPVEIRFVARHGAGDGGAGGEGEVAFTLAEGFEIFQAFIANDGDAVWELEVAGGDQFVGAAEVEGEELDAVVEDAEVGGSVDAVGAQVSVEVRLQGAEFGEGEADLGGGTESGSSAVWAM